jgi:hypothetical protein
MRKGVSTLCLAAAVALAGAPGAWAGSPGPETRRTLLPLGTCDGGPQNAELCVDDPDCEDLAGEPPDNGTCTTNLADVAVRGVLTMISDKDSAGWNDTTFVAEITDDQGNLVPEDFTKSTLTLVLEFTKDGVPFAFAETFQDLGDFIDPELGIECGGFCVPTWREPAVERQVATDVAIRWGVPGAAAKEAIATALGVPGGTPFWEVVSDTALFDHSAEDDVLATVRRMKVQIRVIEPTSP